MQTADLITAFLNNEMTAEQERQFLLSVAASDSLRLGLKSHVMVDRIFQKQLAEAHVAADVKAKIFAEMSASLGQVAPHTAPHAAPSTAPPGPMLPDAAPIAQAAAEKGILGALLTKMGTGIAALSLAVGGFTAGYLVHSESGQPRPAEIHGAAPADQNHGQQTIGAPATSFHQSISAPGNRGEIPSAEAPSAEAPAATTATTQVVTADAPAMQPRLATTRRRASSATAPAESPANVGHSSVDAPASGADPASGPASVTITSPGVSNREQAQSPTSGTEESRVSVKATIRKSNPEDRRQTRQSEDQGMP